MLRARRNINLAESLGPPTRFANVDEVNDEEKNVQRAPSSRRPPLSSASLTTNHGHGKENRFQAATPRERPPLTTANNRQTPNSTYPASLCGSSGSIKKSIALIGTQTPSSTFPVSLPITGAPSAQEPGLTDTDGLVVTETRKEVSQTFEGKRRLSTNEQTAAKETNICEGVAATKEDKPPLMREDKASPTKEEKQASYQSVIHKSKSVPQHLEAGVNHNGKDGQSQTQRNLLPSKLNLEQAMTRRASEDRGTLTPFSGAPPPSRPIKPDSDIITLTSATGEKRFKRLKLLGCGGSSKVFKVVGEEDFQTYALKEVYLKHVDPAIKSAYVNEIKLLKKLSDKPEIITLHYYTFNKQEAILYLLLEYAEMDLNAVLKSHTTANRMASVLYFWNQMLEVVKVIHDEGVIHNDLKPENFVCIGARLKLIDFGIANRIETEKTSIERDIRCGTINYMSPETIEANDDLDCFKVGRPSDIWSLGCILYQMIYGRTPFQHIKNKLKKWQTITDPTVAIPFPQISSTEALIVMKRCLSRNPKERPTINELLDHPFSTMDHR